MKTRIAMRHRRRTKYLRTKAQRHLMWVTAFISRHPPTQHLYSTKHLLSNS
jgi:hypothetical protein